jgi:fructosamine-3-kinase
MSGVHPRTDLDALLGVGHWSIEPADSGGSFGRSWIASDGRRRFFLKEGVNAELLRALADIDVAPPVHASSGEVVVQEFVVGVSPSAQWIDEHIDAVVALVNRYHAKATLREFGQPLSRDQYVAQLSDRVEHSDSAMLREVVDSIGDKATDDGIAQPALTHGDPNTSNFIVRTDGRLCLIDWDDARTSDSMRDIGPLLWWYAHPARWETALRAAGQPDDASTRARIYWWAAARSIDVALWLTEHGERDRAATFENDARAAAHGLPNSRGWWLA